MAYPNDIDSFPTRATDDLIPPEDYNGQNSSIIAIETELGTLPKGSHADVKTRLNSIDAGIIFPRKFLYHPADVGISGGAFTDRTIVTNLNVYTGEKVIVRAYLTSYFSTADDKIKINLEKRLGVGAWGVWDRSKYIHALIQSEYNPWVIPWPELSIGSDTTLSLRFNGGGGAGAGDLREIYFEVLIF